MSKDYQMSDCLALGLTGLPVVVEADKTDGRYRLKSLSMLVRDTVGGVITSDKSMFTAKRLLSEQYKDSDFVVVAFVVDTAYQRFLHDGLALDEFASCNLEYGLACINGPSLTIPQREAAAVIVSIAESHLPPIERQDDYIFPATLDNFAKEDDALSRHCLPWKSFTESKAYEVAEAIIRLYGVDAEVFQDDDGYYVSATHSGKLAANMNRIVAQMDLLRVFDLRSSKITTQSLESIGPDERESIEERATRASRIEDGINAILAHLKRPITNDVGPDSHSLPVPRKPVPEIPPANKRNKAGGKKSSSKQTA